MRNWQDEVVVITGASSGLGQQLALKAGLLKSKVILIARNKEELNKIANKIKNLGGEAFIFDFDLNNVEAIPELYEKIKTGTNLIPSILINNAGYSAAGFIANTPIIEYKKNFNVNLFAPIALIQCIFPDMYKQKKGIIANIMNMAIFHSFPGISSYCSSKLGLKAVHESLRLEVSGTNIKTLYVNPGDFKSNYVKNIQMGDRFKKFKYNENLHGSEPRRVANKIFEAIELGKPSINLSDFKTRIGDILAFFAPNFLYKIIVKRNQKILNERPFI